MPTFSHELTGLPESVIRPLPKQESLKEIIEIKPEVKDPAIATAAAILATLGMDIK